jgi:hypothetical protein
MNWMDCLRDIRIQEVEFEMAIELVEVHEILPVDSNVRFC